MQAAAPDGLVVAHDELPERLTSGYREAVERPGRFRAIRRWWTPSVLFLTVFTVFWDAFLLFWYAMALGGLGDSLMGICFVVFPLGHVAVGVGLTWWVLATWLNRTVVDARDGQLRCSVGPIPWPFGGKREPIALEAVERFEAEAVRSKKVGGHWRVVAVTHDGARVPVVTHLATAPQADYVAWRLDEQRL